MKPLPHLRHIKIICVLLCEPRGKGKNGNQKSFNFAKKGKGYFPTNPSLKNPQDRKWVIGTAIAATALVVSVLALCIACTLLK